MFVLVCSVRSQSLGLCVGYLGGTKTMACLKAKDMVKTRRCSGLDSWIVPLLSLKNKKVFWIGLVDYAAQSLKNRELFLIGLMDRPQVEPYKRGGVPDGMCGLSVHSVPDHTSIEP